MTPDQVRRLTVVEYDAFARKMAREAR